MNPDESVSEDDTTEASAEVTLPPSFFPTVAELQNSLEESTTKPEIPTFAPFIPNILPETSSTVSDETPLMAVIAESTIEPAEESGGAVSPDTTLEATQQEEEAEVDEVEPTEHASGGEAETEDHVTDGKGHFELMFSVKQDAEVESGTLKALLITQTLDCGLESI